MRLNLSYVLITGLLISAYGCAHIDTTAEYDSTAPRDTSDLAVPPGLTSPDLNSNYKMLNEAQVQSGYQLNQIKDMKIVQSGSERWLVVNNKNVNQVWPMVVAFLNQMGLTIKYQNKTIGSIQTDWATRNNAVPQTGIRGLFSWAGWGSMYSMPSQYMFRINLWQNESETLVFVTNYEMDEVYPNCTVPRNSTVETSSTQITSWMPVPPNPQVELDFLLRFMAFAGLSPQQVKQVESQVTTATPLVDATLANNQITLNDQFDRAWWRTGLALERVGLGVTDKNRSSGEYYVYPLQPQLTNPDASFISKWFGSSSSNNANQPPKAMYTVKLTATENQTIITIAPYNGQTLDRNAAQSMAKYMGELVKQLQ